MTANPIDRLLTSIESGTMPSCDAYAADAELDATVPHWRFTRRGAGAILAETSRWFADPGRFDSLRRIPIPGGEVVDFLLTWNELGVPHAAHQVHILEVEDDLIVRDTLVCGGRWPASLLAEMDAAAHA